MSDPMAFLNKIVAAAEVEFRRIHNSPTDTQFVLEFSGEAGRDMWWNTFLVIQTDQPVTQDAVNDVTTRIQVGQIPDVPNAEAILINRVVADLAAVGIAATVSTAHCVFMNG